MLSGILLKEHLRKLLQSCVDLKQQRIHRTIQFYGNSYEMYCWVKKMRTPLKEQMLKVKHILPVMQKILSCILFLHYYIVQLVLTLEITPLWLRTYTIPKIVPSHSVITRIHDSKLLIVLPYKCTLKRKKACCVEHKDSVVFLI